MLKRIAPLLIFLLAIHFTVQAQITTSGISGIVKNATDEALVGATITATHLPSGTKYVTTSRAGGQFAIANMRVGGPYVIEITFVGFVTDRQEDVFLKLAETFLLNSNLKSSTGELTNVVITTGARRNTIMNANRNGAAYNVGKAEIAVLPTISRSLNDLARLTPQGTSTSTGSVAGGNYRQNNITVDGSDFNNTFGIGSNLPAQGSPISLDAIEEISVNITPFDVRQSGFIGSALNAVTRSGTNTFSGSAYTYFRTQQHSGNKVGDATFPRQKYDFSQSGARFGGPIIKNKLFFFVNYETEKIISPGQTNLAATPSAPFGTTSNIARPTRVELDAISDYLRTTYGYETGPYDNYDFLGDKVKFLARLDWNISPKHKINVRYSEVKSSDPAPMSGSYGSTGVTGQNRTANNALYFKNSNYYQDYNFYSLATELNSTFSSKISNTFRFSYNNQNEPRSSDSQIFPFVDIMSGSSVFTTFGYEPFSLGNLRDVKIYSAVNNLNIALGKHNLLVGAQADFTSTLNGFQPLGASYYRFASWSDFVNGVKPTDFAYTYSLKSDYSQAFPKFKFGQYSLLLQDEITFSKQFKLTLGLRADLANYPNEDADLLNGKADPDEIQENPLVSGLTFADGRKVNTGKLPKQRTLFAPRLGFNWDIHGDRSLQLRGGTGIFTGRVPYVWIVGQSGNSGMLQITQSFNGSADTPGPFSADIGTYRPATPPAAGTTMPSTVTVFDENFKMPQTWKTSLAVDVKLPGGMIGTLEGVYNRDIVTIYSKNINLVAPTPLNIAGYPDNRMFYPSAVTARDINKLASGGRGILIPSSNGTTGFTMISTGNENRGHYASLTARIERPLKRGFGFMLAYTKSISNTYFDGGGDQPVNTWNQVTTVNGSNSPELSYANFVVPDRVIAALTFSKQYLKHLGTTVSVFYEGSSQGRFSYTYSNDFNRDGVSADLLYIPTSAQVQQMQFVNTSAINGVVYTPQQQRDLFEAFIQQDKYLKAHRGQYAERNGGLLPWRNQFDVKLLQDVFTNIGKNKNTLQFSLDIFNFANLINRKWGLRDLTSTAYLSSSSNVPILQPQNQNSLTTGGATLPTFRLATDRLGRINTESFIDNVGLGSTYYMQFGFRYIFN